MAYIDTKYLGKCETCRHLTSGGCNTYCDHGEEYSPNLSKILVADVVPRAEHDLFVRLHDELEDELAETYDKLENAKREVAREIFAEIGKIAVLSYGFNDPVAFAKIELERLKELKKKYTENC